MKASIHTLLPNAAKTIREAVFIKEQGFQNEFDDIDQKAIHFVMWDETKPIATCRLFQNDDQSTYTLGRLAVVQAYRGKSIGSMLIQEAEQYVQKNGGNSIILHAQCGAAKFYRKRGYRSFGEIDDDEGCPHIWMKRVLHI